MSSYPGAPPRMFVPKADGSDVREGVKVDFFIELDQGHVIVVASIHIEAGHLFHSIQQVYI